MMWRRASSQVADMPRLDLLVVDEAHHVVADSYRRNIDRVREAIGAMPCASFSRRC
jgi:superfamily II DNA or RNA helicase